ncbi:MAG: DUF3298 domain-containing protein [Acidobacteriota bacterium]
MRSRTCLSPVALGIVCGLLAGLMACTPAPDDTLPDEPAPNAPAAYTTVTVERSAGACDEPDAPCATFSARYPRFLSDEVTGTPDEPALRALDAAVERILLAATPGETTATTLDEQAETFLAGWRDTVEAFPDQAVPMRWASEKTIEVVERSPRVVSLRLDEYANTGGAHPNSYTAYTSLDPSTGRIYTLDDVLRDDTLPRLEELAEAAFRTARDLEPGVSLNAAGFYFDNDTFALAANWAILGDSLVIHYNPYEVGPYVLGPTEITLDATALAPLIDPSGPMSD